MPAKSSWTKRRKRRVAPVDAEVDDKSSCVVAQSPIDLVTDEATTWSPKKPLLFTGHWSDDGEDAVILNNGSTAYLTMPDSIGKTMVLSGGPLADDYIFEQLHFHWSEKGQRGSEHSLDGNKYDAEAHLVHYNSKYKDFQEAVDKKDGLAVIGFFLKIRDRDNEHFATISNAVSKISKKDQETTLKSSCLKWMLGSKFNEYFTYKGSLTTHPFFESVTWIVYTSPVDISNEQIEPFRAMEIYLDGKCVTCNARPVQSTPKGLCLRRVIGKRDWKYYYLTCWLDKIYCCNKKDKSYDKDVISA